MRSMKMEWVRRFRPCGRGLAASLALAILLGLGALVEPSSTHTAQAQGGVRFVNGAGIPLASATMRVLCYATSSVTAPIADVQLTTDAAGRSASALPANCNYVAALQLLHTQPSGKANHGPAYWTYATSWSPLVPVLLPATGSVTVTANNPLVLFNVVVGMEWNPPTGSSFVADVTNGLRNTSAYLYDLTDGQMAIGPVTIHAGGRNWNTADIRMRAANDYRPSARVGGIVSAATPYTTTALTGTVYVPGDVMVGRYWDGEEASNPALGRWSLPNAYRTLAHEWAHYALFLYDEYQDIDANSVVETYCTCADLPKVSDVVSPTVCGGVTNALATSAMAFHYTASELWRSGSPAVCTGTNQWQVHGEQDWQTLAKWSKIQKLPTEWLHVPGVVNAGPSLGIAGALFGRWPGYRAYLPVVVGNPAGSGSASHIEPAVTLTVSRTFGGAELMALYPQVYLSTSVSSAQPARLVPQGTTFGARSLPSGLGQITVFGVPANNGRARVYLDYFRLGGGAGTRYVYPGRGASDPPLANGQTLKLVTDTWRSSLDVAYGMTGRALSVMTATLVSLDALGAAPVIELCLPDTGCPGAAQWRKAMSPAGVFTWTAVLTAAASGELPNYGVVHIQATAGRELMRWYLAGGGVGPAHIDGNAPLRDGMVMVDLTQREPGRRNQFVVMPAADFAALNAGVPGGVRGIIGTPWDIDVLLPRANLQLAGAADEAATAQQQQPRLLITLFYSQRAIERLGLSEAQIRVIHFDRVARQWRLVQTGGVGSSPTTNWVSSGPVDSDGIYALAWIGSP